ncbi:hypothetical protein [Actinomadura sp. 3N508]|uniref:hypothetical protein n=1 Tax=Actinomadura sp. 3N508 TaxID=3375153 RepID=UPI0037A2310F
MRQGSFHYATVRRRSLGGLIGYAKERLCLVVSNDRFNDTPGNEHVWVLHTRTDGGGLALAALDHLRQADPREEETTSQEYVDDALEWVRWGHHRRPAVAAYVG